MDNVFGYITDHSILFEQQVLPRIPDGVRKWNCSGALLAFGTMIGCDGACMLLGNIAPALCMDIISAGFHGDYAKAVELQRVASRLNPVVMQSIGSPKIALSMLGWRSTGMRARGRYRRFLRSLEGGDRSKFSRETGFANVTRPDRPIQVV